MPKYILIGLLVVIGTFMIMNYWPKLKEKTKNRGVPIQYILEKLERTALLGAGGGSRVNDSASMADHKAQMMKATARSKQSTQRLRDANQTLLETQQTAHITATAARAALKEGVRPPLELSRSELRHRRAYAHAELAMPSDASILTSTRTNLCLGRTCRCGMTRASSTGANSFPSIQTTGAEPTRASPTE